MFEDVDKRRQAAKWVVGVVTVCILVYLDVRHIEQVASAVSWLVDLFQPLLIGGILALILNVPKSAIEARLFQKNKTHKMRRPLAIILALVLVLGIFIGAAFLVVPELIAAVRLIMQISIGGLDALAQLEESVDWSQIPLGEYLSQISIDWQGLRAQLEQWFSSHGGNIANRAMGTIGLIAAEVLSVLIGLVFSIYILARKEELKRQVCRLIRVWPPQRLGGILLHVSIVCSNVFRLFIAGQATEAVILGTMCMIGMAVLRIPYAPMIEALVGVTALIPIVGAFVGTIVGAIMI